MTPQFSGIDHIHVYVANRDAAAHWYESVLGLKRVEGLMLWATDDGPLTMENPEHTVHLALFERKNHPGASAIAFGANGENFMAWKTHLERHRLELRIADHEIMYSLYFKDPDGNLHEITSNDYDYIATELSNG